MHIAKILSLKARSDTLSTMLRAPKHPYLIAWLCWLIFSSLLVLACLPRIQKAIEQSGVREMLASRSVEQVASDTRQVNVSFVDSSLANKLYRQWQKRLGGDAAHDTLENLLGGPNVANVQLGAASFIAPGTRLIGCTLSNRILFVDLSKEFLDSLDLDKAVRQVEETMCAFESIDQVSILVEGTPLSELREK